MGKPNDLMADAVKHHQAGNYPEAEKLYCQILEGNPFHAEALHLLGVLAHQIGRHQVAIDYIQRAIRIRPTLAEAHYNLGIIQMAQGKPDVAAACYREALRLKPDYAEALNCLGIILKEQKNPQEAMACYRQALQLQPNLAPAHNNIGNLMMDQDRLEEATACYREALRINPNFFEAYNNLGNTLQRMGKQAEAVVSYDLAIRVKADYGEAHWNKSLALLVLGEFEEGWREYEWRWKSKTFKERSFRQPLWNGSPIPNGTILLHAEQGLGDTLQFIRYVPFVKERIGRVLFECPKALLKLLADFEGIDQLVPVGSSMPSFDVQAPLLSLPGLLGTNLSNIPVKIPYLSAQPSLVEHWRQELSAMPGFKIGIAWQGSAANLGDNRRSIPLTQFAPLARVPGVSLLSLQKGIGTEQIGQVADQFTVVDLGDRLDEANGPFMDTAAVMKNLDLVVTADTATAHLAGALGVPVWIALAYMADWRWLLERSDSPWYPSVRLFRQQRAGDWSEIFERMAVEVVRMDEYQRTPRTAPTILVDVAPGEVIDKITILQIKSERITDLSKVQNVRAELSLLEAACGRFLMRSPELEALTAELKAVNERLWDIEDDIRDCERQQDFGVRFIELARAVYHNNDQRAALKRRVNELLGSTILEEKSYADYSGAKV